MEKYQKGYDDGYRDGFIGGKKDGATLGVLFTLTIEGVCGLITVLAMLW